MSTKSLLTPKSAENSDVGEETKVPQHQQILWNNVLRFISIHVLAVYGAYRMVTSSMWQTIVFAIVLDILSLMGITAGAHRLWTHRSYKAKLPLKIFLAFLNSIAFQNDIIHWSRDHRVHHKFSDTDADPHNANRGFFFSHIGWLMVKKHPEVRAKGKSVDISDLLADPVLQFQRKHYRTLAVVLCFVLPTVIPMVLWGESFSNAFLVAGMLRYALSLNQTFLVNSAAHLWGNRPYDQHINPKENTWVILGAFGEGFHNYHHTFPWDYATGEYGVFLNVTTAFLNSMEWLGLAYDLKTASPEIIKERKMRTGEVACHLFESKMSCRAK